MSMKKMWLVKFQLWLLCFTSLNSRQVEIGFAEAGDITVSNPQRIGEVVGTVRSRELGFLRRKTMVHALSGEDELNEGLVKSSRRRVSEENKDSEKFSARFEDRERNEVEHTRLVSKRSLRLIESPIVEARKTRRVEEENRESEEEKLLEEAEKVAQAMHNDYKEFSHSRPPANNHQPRHLQETSKP